MHEKDIDAALDFLTPDIRLETASRVEYGHISIRVPLRMLLDYGFATTPKLTCREADGAILAEITTPLGRITAQFFVDDAGMIANIIAV